MYAESNYKGVIYPVETNQLEFCTKVNYTTFWSGVTQSAFNASKTFSNPVLELPTGLVVPINETLVQYATTQYTWANGVNASLGSAQIIDITKVDDEAKRLYDTLVNVLKRYNCRDFYPYKSCNACIDAYKDWACAIVFPQYDVAQGGNNTLKLCEDVCWHVVQRCPVETEFNCPTDDTLVSGTSGCNALGLDTTSNSHRIHPTGLLWSTALIVLATLFNQLMIS